MGAAVAMAASVEGWHVASRMVVGWGDGSRDGRMGVPGAYGVGGDTTLRGVLEMVHELSVPVEKREQAAEEICYLLGEARSRMG